MSTEFLLTSLIVVASPGTGVVYTLAAGLAHGRRHGIVAAFGCTLGILPHVAAAVLGLAALLHASALAFQTVKYAGVAYLLYMAWDALREQGALRVDEAGRIAAAPSAARVIMTAIVINVLNPKLSIFFLAFLPQFMPAGDPHPLATMVTLSGWFMAITFAVFAIYGLLAAAARDRVLGQPPVVIWLRRAFGGAFVALGAKLAVTDR